MGAGTLEGVVQVIEGTRIADLCWGTPQAKYAVLRFGIYRSQTNGMMCVAIRNFAGTKSFVMEFSYAGSTVNKYFEEVMVIPPCTTGSWPTDNSGGMIISFMMFVGSTYQTATKNAWVDGSFLGTTALTNYKYDNFYLNDFGLYVDPNMTGVAPPFAAQHIEDELQDCLRYWYKCTCARGVVMTATQTASYMPHFVPMRAAPALSVVGTLRLYDSAAAPNITSVSGTATIDNVQNNINVASGLTIGRPVTVLSDGQVANYIAVNARM
jgi:hypothetical protein